MFFFFQAEGGIRDVAVTGVQTCALPILAAERAAGRTRYRMLETLRQYAADELGRAGEGDALSAAHAEFYLALAEQAETGLRSSAQPQWTQALNQEHPNVRAALAWLTATDRHADQALRLAGSLRP